MSDLLWRPEGHWRLPRVQIPVLYVALLTDFASLYKPAISITRVMCYYLVSLNKLLGALSLWIKINFLKIKFVCSVQLSFEDCFMLFGYTSETIHPKLHVPTLNVSLFFQR
jgi:hypothetical protein